VKRGRRQAEAVARPAVLSPRATLGPSPPTDVSSVTPAPAIALRRATPEDAAALATFAARTFRETYAPPAGPCDPDDVEAYVAEHFGPALQAAELADPDLRVLVAERGGAMAGYAVVRTESRPTEAAQFAAEPGEDAAALAGGATAELARLYVDRPWHGSGVAATLLDAARAEAAAAGARALWFSVYQRNPRALAFYRKRGARPIARATFTMGNEVQHDWLLAVPAADAAP
jgi:diamine N-acetyltransferase